MTEARTAEKPRRSPVKAMLGTSSIVFGASLMAVSLAGGTYGLWADSAPINAGIVTAGELDLTVNTATISPTDWSTMFPGDRVRQSVTLTSSSDVASDVTVVGTATGTQASNYSVRIAKGACTSSALPGANVIGASANLGTWNADEASTVCVEVMLAANATSAAQGQPVPFTLVFTATQKVV